MSHSHTQRSRLPPQPMQRLNMSATSSNTSSVGPEPVLRRNLSAAASNTTTSGPDAMLRSSSSAAGVKQLERQMASRSFSTDSTLDYTHGTEDSQTALRRSNNIKQHSTIRPGMYRREGAIIVPYQRSNVEQELIAVNPNFQQISPDVKAKFRHSSSLKNERPFPEIIPMNRQYPKTSPKPQRSRDSKSQLYMRTLSLEKGNNNGERKETNVADRKAGGSLNSERGSGKRLPPVLRQRSKQMQASNENCNIISDGDSTQNAPTWNTYLYQLQQQAPKPICIQCQYEVPNKPPQYGKEYHGSLSRQEADQLLQQGDGCYLIRKSERAPDAASLAIRFEGETKNYKLFFDGTHYVGEKRFDSIHDLVADGLIHFFIELRAADYIQAMSQESNYEESPYMAYNMKRQRMGKGSKADASVNGAETASTAVDDERAAPATDVRGYEKPHIFKVQNFIGLHWCDLCANFMWGLLAQGVKCQDCGAQAHKKCSERLPNDCMPDMKYIKRIYGGDLTTVVKANNRPVPCVVEKCVKEIELRGIDQEGVYRLAGFHDDVEAVRMAFDKDAENTEIGPSKYDDINTICSALKLYFRLLPIPLITTDVYNKIIEVIKKDQSDTEAVRQMKEPLMSLPPAHFHTLKYMCSHLSRVVAHKSKNMMSSENLAIVFAPTLMRSDNLNPMQSLIAVKYEQKLMERILQNHTQLLGKS